MRKITVLVDSREQRPLLFPKRIVVHTTDSAWNGKKPHVYEIVAKERKLDAGDYTIEGSENVVLIERKGSIDELIKNITMNDRKRFLAAVEKMIEACEYPYLYLECLPLSTWTCFSSRDGRGTSEAMRALDVIFELMAAGGLRLIWGGRKSTQVSTRRRLGELILRIMLKHVQVSEQEQQR